MTDKDLAAFSDWHRVRFSLLRGEEYFIISRCANPDEPLYVVLITADSLFTAMYELTDLIARKF